MGSNYVGLRMAVVALCFLGGFFHLLFFIPAAILAWSLAGTPEEFHEAQRPKPESSSIRRVRVRAEDPGWKARYLGACESPAESSFLSAMIAGFSLQPQLGMLTGSGLALDMQVGMGRYRLDFLANGWLGSRLIKPTRRWWQRDARMRQKRTPACHSVSRYA